MSSGALYTTAPIRKMVEEARPIFAGQPSLHVGAALADLLAIWLAGHFIPGNAESTRSLREALLTNHVEHVRGLIGPNAHAIGAPP